MDFTKRLDFRIVLLVLTTVWQVESQEENSLLEFRPSVTARCHAGVMTITVITEEPFTGVIHSRNHRRPACSSLGTGEKKTILHVSLLSREDDDTYCGHQFNTKTEEWRVPVAVRIHKTLELADDKFYVITCGKQGFTNSRNQTSIVSLKLLEDGRKTVTAVLGRQYVLRAQISRPDESYGIRVQNCFSFSNATIDPTNSKTGAVLVDENGCAMKNLISEFVYNETSGTADAMLYSMFKLPDSNQVNFQCDIVLCNGRCKEPDCGNILNAALTQRARSAVFVPENEDGVVMAATSVYVVEPGAAAALCYDRAPYGIPTNLLFYLCIAFGILFLIMMIINIFLCSAMNCSCTKTEVIEKEPSIIDEYDPYKAAWNGSHYGSRYSLNGKPSMNGYLSNGSTMNSTQQMEAITTPLYSPGQALVTALQINIDTTITDRPHGADHTTAPKYSKHSPVKYSFNQGSFYTNQVTLTSILTFCDLE